MYPQRFHYTIKQKLHILDLVREEQWMQLAAQFPRVTQKQIDDWSQKENEMRRIPQGQQARRFTLHPGPEVKYKELYQFLYQTFKGLRAQNKAVTGEFLLSLAETEDPRLNDLGIKGRHSLIQRFMETYNLSIREITGHSGASEEAISEEQKTHILTFQAKYRQMITEKRIPPENVFNMDQTSVYYENPTSRTIEVKGVREVCAKTQQNEKKRVTLFSLVNAKGQLFNQLVVFKGVRDARIHSEVEEYDDGLTFHTVQENAWTDGLVLIDWLYKIWRPICKFTEGPKLLILDAHPLHRDFKESFSVFEAEVLFIPAGLTWTLQPLDAGFHNVYKEQLRKAWTMNQEEVVQNEKDNREALSNTLKEVHQYLADEMDNSVFWKKAGLGYGLDAQEDEVGVIEAEDTGRDQRSLVDLMMAEDGESGRNLSSEDLRAENQDFTEKNQDQSRGNESTIMELE